MRGTVVSVGNQIGVGKESGSFFFLFFFFFAPPLHFFLLSPFLFFWFYNILIFSLLDIFLVMGEDGKQYVMKLHRYPFPFSLHFPHLF